MPASAVFWGASAWLGHLRALASFRKGRSSVGDTALTAQTLRSKLSFHAILYENKVSLRRGLALPLGFLECCSMRPTTSPTHLAGSKVQGSGRLGFVSDCKPPSP